MARIRTVKPELFAHEDLFDLEQQTGLPIRLAFIGLFTCCDREGRFKWRPRTLKKDVMPHDDVDFSRVLDALATGGFVQKYAIGTDEYGVIPTWEKHQVINNREAKSEIPAPEENPSLSDTSTRESRVDDAKSDSLCNAQGEGKGREGKGKEEEGEQHVERRDAAPDRDAPEKIFAYWQKTMDSPRSMFDDKRRKLILAALKTYDPRQLCEAVKGCERSDFHMARGKYAGNNKQNGLGLILRDAEHIDKFIEMASQRAPGVENIEQRNARIMAELMAEDGGTDSNVIDIDMEELTDAH